MRRWTREGVKQALLDLGFWLLVGLTITQAFKHFTPGYPVIVGTPSIPTGLYWLNTTQGPAVGEAATFLFAPKQDWLRERYADRSVHIHTKRVIGLAGDTVRAKDDQAKVLEICPASGAACRFAGRVPDVDRKGRPLRSWLAEQPGHTYTLKVGEAWLFGEHRHSLDSRYYGPLAVSEIRGRARPILLFQIGEPMDVGT